MGPCHKRLADLCAVYGHGLLAFGFSKAFVGFGLAMHAAACYMSYQTES